MNHFMGLSRWGADRIGGYGVWTPEVSAHPGSLVVSGCVEQAPNIGDEVCHIGSSLQQPGSHHPHLRLYLLLLTLIVTEGCGRRDEATPVSADAKSRSAKTDDKLASRSKNAPKPIIPIKPLLGKIPPSLRHKLVPIPEVDLAFAIRSFLDQNKNELHRSLSTPGIRPTKIQSKLLETINPHVPRGLNIEGWVVEVRWSVLRTEGGSSVFDYSNCPPIYELALTFPEEASGISVWLWAHNYHFDTCQYTIPNSMLGGIKKGDWLRVSGILSPKSQAEWSPGKPLDFVSMGEMTITSIERINP